MKKFIIDCFLGVLVLLMFAIFSILIFNGINWLDNLDSGKPKSAIRMNA